MTDEARTAEQRTQDHTAMGHSVDLINDIVAGNQDDLDAADRQDIVDRNVEHLQLMVAKTDWDGEDMTASNSAITAGQGYTAA
jgi:carbamoylphosphate synthase large subunit